MGVFLTHGDDHKRVTDPAGKAGTRPRFPLRQHGKEAGQLEGRKVKTTKLKFNNWIPKILKVGAITFYPWVFIANKKEDTATTLITHEMVHVWQVRQHGWFSFYISYCLYWLAGLIRWKSHNVAYREIPFEQDAYGKQSPDMADWMTQELKGQW